ncbi:unnamed protein product [Cunninghamella echinulata]
MPKAKRNNKNNRNKQGYEFIPSPTQETTYNSINTNIPQYSHSLTSGQGYFTTSPQNENLLIDINDNLSNDSNTNRNDMNYFNSQTFQHNNNNNNLNINNDMNNNDCESNVDTTASHQDDICIPTFIPKEQETGIDYFALDAYLEEERHNIKTSPSTPTSLNYRRRRLSTMVDSRRISLYGDRKKFSDIEDSNTFRITYYSTAEESTIHARHICEIPSEGKSLSDMIKKGCFWLDILNPTDSEMKSLCQVFRIHPLTEEDITMEEQREKCDVYHNYYFICFRSFEQDPMSPFYLQPLAMYIVVLKEGVVTFHFKPTPHPQNVRKRIKQLRDYIKVTPDWICYGLLDNITDSFAPLIKSIEFEVDSIDELVLILKESEQSDMLRRIGYCRKRVMSLLRLLVPKADVVKTLIKRGETKPADATWPALSTEVSLFLGDVQDHILTMLQSLNHYEKISSRSHSNYLAQISIEMTQTNNDINDILSKLTALGSILVPMNLVTGLWGMNVMVPGQLQEDLTWFTCITGSILTFCISMTLLMRYYNIV